MTLTDFPDQVNMAVTTTEGGLPDKEHVNDLHTT